MRPMPYEPFQKAPPFVRGLAIIRDLPTPVVDMRVLLGEMSLEDPGRFVTVRVNERMIALSFDAVLGVHVLDAARTFGLPPLLKNLAGETVSDVAARDGDLLLLFEASRIFPPGMIESLLAEAAHATA